MPPVDLRAVCLVRAMLPSNITESLDRGLSKIDTWCNLLGMRLNANNDMAASWYDMGMRKLPQRLQRCIDRNANYVEKWINVQALK